MNIIVFGGDGFCGWPTSLYLSDQGHNVTIVDNLSRRKIDLDLGTNSLTPISSIQERVKTWNSLSNNKISFLNIDISIDYEVLKKILLEKKPNAVIHFAEQRSAPYSMISSKEKRYTINNNINATSNLLNAVLEVDKSIHIIHLGTMGVYGYGQVDNSTIPEGYLKVLIEDNEGNYKEKEIMHPAAPGSIYHTSKTLDALLFYFFNKNDNLRITDLHQGIVWGTNIEQNLRHDKLVNRFDYDGDYGTVLNRFLMQAAINHPLTVHGSGKQTRALIHIQNSVECINIALNSIPKDNERVQIFNQMTETKKIIDLANEVSKLTGVSINHLDNPRKEADENSLNVLNQQFLAKGLEPIYISEKLMNEVTTITKKYSFNVDREKIIAKSKW
jgi:UDP-sulfoquinovose synthase